jgi:alkylation response protein AidB-like acyl-CoA dehydrogenase
MNFELPEHLTLFLSQLDDFIENEIKPLEQQDDNIRFFDYRRENSRTDWDNQGLPTKDWEALMYEAKCRADKAGFYRYALPEDQGGRNGGNLDGAVIREHLASKGLGLHHDLQNEHSVVGNHVNAQLLLAYGTQEHYDLLFDSILLGKRTLAVAITEPHHGSDATHMETTATKYGNDWVINGEKTWNSEVHISDYNMVFARTSGNDGDAEGITAFLVPMTSPGAKIEEYLWTFNMPTSHARVSFSNVRVPSSAIIGAEGQGLKIAQHFFNENRLRQAANSLGAGVYCINESIKYAKERKPFGKPLATNQGIQFPLVELQTRAEMLRAFIQKTAWMMDKYGAFSQSDKVSMCNFAANRFCCDAADQAIQVHGGIGYSRHKQFEHIYRHHRRYRITEGADEIQMRRVAGYMFGFMKQQTPKGM